MGWTQFLIIDIIRLLLIQTILIKTVLILNGYVPIYLFNLRLKNIFTFCQKYIG